MLYSDPDRQIDSVLWPAVSRAAADSELKDEYGVMHRLWRVTDPGTTLSIRTHMEPRKLIIADGHHRYETALAYRNERRVEVGMDLADFGRTGHMAVNAHAPFENLMMTFVNMDDEGLLILPTHRVVFGLDSFAPEKMLSAAEALFTVTDLHDAPAPAAVESLRAAGEEDTAFIARTSGRTVLLRARRDAVEKELASLSPLQRRLDVVQLHRLLLEGVLGISEQAIRDQANLEYLRSADEAFARVAAGANVAFLMNPVKIAQMRDVAFAGEVMPQKSTDFYPKLMSGLTIYGVD